MRWVETTNLRLDSKVISNKAKNLKIVSIFLMTEGNYCLRPRHALITSKAGSYDKTTLG